MSKYCFYILLGLFFCETSYAQKHKVGEVLVLGSGPAAIAAGIQSARSGVKTVILSEKNNWDTASITPVRDLKIHPFLKK